MAGKHIFRSAMLVVVAMVLSTGPAAAQWYPIGRAFVPVPPSEVPAPPAPAVTLPTPVEPGDTMMGTTGISPLLGGTLESGRTLQVTAQTEGAPLGIPALAGSPSLSGSYALPATDTDIALAASGIITPTTVPSTVIPGVYQSMQVPSGGALPGTITQPFGPYPVFGGPVVPSYVPGGIPSTSTPPGVRTVVPGIPGPARATGTAAVPPGTLDRR